MEWGGKNVNHQTKQLIRVSGLIVPVLLLVYGLLILTGVLASVNFVSDTIFYFICIPWVILGALQYLFKQRTKTISLIILGSYHLFACAYLWFISGLSVPLISSWVILFLAVFAYFKLTGFYLSILVFVVACGTDTLLQAEDRLHMIETIISFLVTVLVGFIVIKVSQSQLVDKETLDKSQADKELARDRILSIVNNLADAILSTDKDGIIQVYNAASLNLLDTNTGLNGKSIDSVIRLSTIDNKPLKLRKAFRMAKGVVSREDIQATISGETIRLSLVYSPIRSSDSADHLESEGYVVILRDITKQKSLEEERDEFIGVVSHELRTPITIAEGTLSNVQLMMSRPDIPEPTLVKNIALAHDQVVFLARLVNDLSTLSRAERGVADEPEDIDVTSMVHDLYNEYAPQAESKAILFNLDLDPNLGSVNASRLYLKELLQNFVTNAIKYTKEGSISLHVSKTEGELLFSVKDTGIGMSKTDQAHIFEKFYRSEDYRTRETGGTGLGLYVAIKLAKKLGTTIHMTSRLNHGSEFKFNLPITKIEK